MITSPFPLLLPHADRMHVRLWNRSDDRNAAAVRTHVYARTAHLQQVHGGRAIVVREAVTDPLPEADACATDTKGLLLLTKSADCQSMVLYAPSAHACAVVHAGWKGLLAHVIGNTVILLTKEWKIRPEELLVGIAPSLGMCCAEFSDPAAELPGIDTRLFHGRHADLQGIGDAQLLAAGVRKEHIDRMTLCTRCNRDLLWSYRADREHVNSGHHNLLGVMLT